MSGQAMHEQFAAIRNSKNEASGKPLYQETGDSPKKLPAFPEWMPKSAQADMTKQFAAEYKKQADQFAADQGKKYSDRLVDSLSFIVVVDKQAKVDTFFPDDTIHFSIGPIKQTIPDIKGKKDVPVFVYLGVEGM